MLTRRHLLSGIALGGLTIPFVRHSATALTLEPMPKSLGDAIALHCSAKADTVSLTSADHGDLLARMRDTLLRKIAAGADPKTAQEVAVCPLCGCPLTVTVQNSF